MPPTVSSADRLVVLATGGTIAGHSAVAGAEGDAHYRAASLSAQQLVDAVPALSAWPLEVEQLAQVDSKDMSLAIWRQLAQRCAQHLARPEVRGIVITHGTDTLEETAWFLQRVLAPAKPVVLVAAMRPASSLQADGPQNLLDAALVAAHPGARGVVAVMQGVIHGPWQVRKVHATHLDAFSSGIYGAIGRVVLGQVQVTGCWPGGRALGADGLRPPADDWARVGVLVSHAGADAPWLRAQVQAAIDAGLRGLMIEGTGNATVHEALLDALAPARQAGLAVWVGTRCQHSGAAQAPSAGANRDLPGCSVLTCAAARVELMLRLMYGLPVDQGFVLADVDAR